MTDQQWHRLFPDDYDEALMAGAGAYRGTFAANGLHGDAIRACVEEAFNAGFNTALANPDGVPAVNVFRKEN